MEQSSPVVSDLVAGRVRKLRLERGWKTPQQLAERCAEIGAPELTTNALYALESGRRGPDGRRRRHVTVDELLALAYALEVSPLTLLLPTENDEYPVSSTVVAPARTVYEWLVGQLLPPFPFPLEGVTDEDRARAWFVFTRLVRYIPEASAHWLVSAELERLKEREQRLVAEAKLREAMESRLFAKNASEALLHETQDQLKHLYAQLDKARREADEQGSSDDSMRRRQALKEGIRRAESRLGMVHYHHHGLVEELAMAAQAMKELDNGVNDGDR